MLKPLLVLSGCIWLAGCNATTQSQLVVPGKTAAQTATLIIGLDTPLSSRWHAWNYSSADNSVLEHAADDFEVTGMPAHHGLIAVQVVPGDPQTTRYGPADFTLKGASYFQYCSGQKLPAITLKPGDVVYAGDIHMWWTDHGDVGMRFSHDFDRATQFVKRNYPELAARLQDRPFGYFVISASVC